MIDTPKDGNAPDRREETGAPFTPLGQTLEAMRGFGALVGYRLTKWREGYAEVTLDLEDRHSNRSSLTHGGVIATLIDVAGGYAGVFSTTEPRMSVTLSMTVQFVGRATGGRLIAQARARAQGRSVYFSTVDLEDDAGTLVATGEGVYKYRTGARTPGNPDATRPPPLLAPEEETGRNNADQT